MRIGPEGSTALEPVAVGHDVEAERPIFRVESDALFILLPDGFPGVGQGPFVGESAHPARVDGGGVVIGWESRDEVISISYTAHETNISNVLDVFSIDDRSNATVIKAPRPV